MEKYPGKLYVRRMLSYGGYKDLMFLLSKDAIDFFLEQGVYKREILKLRDFEGNNIFDEKGYLTDAGLIAYNLSLNGEKAYLLPSQPLPSTSKKADMTVKKLISQGYTEITTTEYAYIMEKTRCNEHTLVSNLAVKIVPVSYEKRRFLIILPPQKNPLAEVPYYLVQQRRKENKSASNNAPVYSTTFGTGTRRPFVCKEDGNLDTLGS